MFQLYIILIIIIIIFSSSFILYYYYYIVYWTKSFNIIILNSSRVQLFLVYYIMFKFNSTILIQEEEEEKEEVKDEQVRSIKLLIFNIIFNVLVDKYYNSNEHFIIYLQIYLIYKDMYIYIITNFHSFNMESMNQRMNE